MPMAMSRTRWSALAASALIQSCAGSSYCFGVYSPVLKASQGYDQSELDAVAVFKDIGANAGVLSGFLAAWAPAGRRRPWIVLLTGAALFAAGYLPMWLAVAGVARAPLPLMCLYMLLAAQAQTFVNTADVVTAVENFPDRRGTVIGIMKGFLGLSGAILVQVYRTLHIDPSSFILMLAVLPTAITLLLMHFVDVLHNAHQPYNRKFIDAFSLAAVTLAGYLMIVIISDQAFMISSPAQGVCFGILLLLMLSPLAIVLKAHKSESSVHPAAAGSTSSEQRTGLLQEASESTESSTSSKNSTESNNQDQDHLSWSSGKENLNLLQAMCKLDFWLLFLAMACGMGSGLATVNNISQIGASLGYKTKETSTLVSLWSIWNFSGRFGAGFVSDHFLGQRGVGRPFFIGATLLIMSLGHAIVASGLPASLYVGSVLVGLCYGSQWALMPSITSEIFGLDHFGTIFNVVTVASPVGSYILSVRVLGYIYDMETTPDEHACVEHPDLCCQGLRKIQILKLAILSPSRTQLPRIDNPRAATAVAATKHYSNIDAASSKRVHQVAQWHRPVPCAASPAARAVKNSRSLAEAGRCIRTWMWRRLPLPLPQNLRHGACDRRKKADAPLAGEAAHAGASMISFPRDLMFRFTTIWELI